MTGIVIVGALSQPLVGALGGAVHGAILALVAGAMGNPVPWKSTAKAGAAVGGVFGVVGAVVTIAGGAMMASAQGQGAPR